MKQWVSVLLLIFLVLPEAFASEEQNLEEKSGGETLQKIRQTIIDTDLKKRKAMRTLLQVSHDIENIAKEKGQLSNDLLALKADAKTAAKNIVDLEEKISVQKKSMGKSLGAIYRLSGQSFFRMIFSGGDSGSLERNMRFLSLIVERDHKMIKKFRESVVELHEERKVLNQKVAKILGVQKEIKSKETNLLSVQRRRTQMIEKLTQEREKNISELEKLHSNGILSSEGEQFASWRFFEKKGKLALPTQGKLIRGYGLVAGDNQRVWLSHKGHSYERSADGKVFAVGFGRVAYSGSLEGYGLVVVVDHGDHYYSVYGHLEEVWVSQGDELERGEPFAKTAKIVKEQTAESQDSGLYFEIRHFSQPEDPKNWLSAEEIKVSSVDSSSVSSQ